MSDREMTTMIHENPDKLMHDKPPGDKSAIYQLHPFRCLFVSMPGGGKRQACLELIGRHPKPFGTITVMHLDSGTSEYEILGENAKMISEGDLPDGGHSGYGVACGVLRVLRGRRPRVDTPGIGIGNMEVRFCKNSSVSLVCGRTKKV